MRAVLDPNVIISALLSPTGAPARILRAWLQGAFELVVSPSLLAELDRALGYPKLRRRISPGEGREVTRWLKETSSMASDPTSPPPIRSTDPDDDYLIALAMARDAVLVTGDTHLLVLAERLPVYSPAAFQALLETEGLEPPK